jgi:acid phosphatase (class A)
MFTPTLGDRFSAEKLPKAAAFFQRVTDSEDEVVDPAKKVFGRKRPFQASADVQKIEPASSSGSWPSGHTTRVTMCAIILAAMLPEQREAIWARAADYAQSRIVLGMHYPLDLEAGQRAGTAMAALMFAGPSFPMDYEAAKAEVRTALAP